MIHAVAAESRTEIYFVQSLQVQKSSETSLQEKLHRVTLA